MLCNVGCTYSKLKFHKIQSIFDDIVFYFKVSICTQYFAEQLAGVDRCDVYTNVHLWLILRLPNDQEKSFTFGFKLKKTIFVVVYFLASIPTLYCTSIF